MTLAFVALGFLAGVWSLPAVSDGLSLLKVIVGRRPAPRTTQASSQHLLVLVPAHDEERMIRPCVDSLLSMDTGQSTVQIVVVADNCGDSTAQIARDAGATVLERTAPEAPGKPQAIQWALDLLPVEEFDAVVIVDADTTVENDFAGRLVSAGPLRGVVHQAYYGIFSSKGTWLNELAELLVQIRYEGQYPFKQRAGLNCPMTGNGMCIGVEVLERSGWSDDSLTENWDMYARYTANGERILLAAGARLAALEPAAMGESSTRRRRWQAGKWQVLRDHAGALIRARGVSVHQKLDALGELTSPGPIAHSALGLGAAVLLYLLPGSATNVFAAVFALSIAPMIAWTVYGLVKHPRPARMLLNFTRLPFYVAWRLTVIVAAVPTALRGAWVRSPRD